MQSTHPYLYFLKKDMERIRESGFSKPEYLEEASFTCKHYDTKVTYELPPKQPPKMDPPKGFSGSVYPYWTAMARNLEDRLKDMALAYLAIGDERYAQKAISYTVSLCQWDTWTEMPYNNSLSVSHITVGVASVYDLLYDKLTSGEREIIKKGLINIGLEGLLKFSKDWFKAIHNGSVLIHSALGMASLALYDEVKEVRDYVIRAKDYAKWWLDQALNSGKTEGVLYNGYALDNLVKFLLALKNATGNVELLEHPYIKECVTPWLLYFSSSDFKTITNFSDSTLNSWSSYAVVLTILNQSMDDSYAGWYLSKLGIIGTKDHTFNGIAYGIGEVGSIKGPQKWPTSRAFPVGWVALRTGWEKKDSVLAFKSTSSDLGHNHYAQNHFIFNVNGQWLIADQGYKDYNAIPFTTGTQGHNSLLVNGDGQVKRGGGRIETFVDSKAFSYVVGDASEAYSNIKWKRHIILVKEGGYYIFFDQVISCVDGKELSFLLHPNKELNKVIVDGNNLTCTFCGDDARAIWKVAIPNKININQVIRKDVPGEEFYFSISPPGNVERFAMVSLLYGEVGEVTRTLKLFTSQDTEEYIALEVHRERGRDIIIINRSGAEVDCRGVITDANVAVISKDEEGMVVSMVGGNTLFYEGKIPPGLEKL